MSLIRLQQYPDSTKRRAVRLVVSVAVLLLCGAIYAVICSIVGDGIPCMFRKLTGFKCPGCGVSRMCLCLLRGDVAGAWAYNPAVLCLSLPAAAVAADVCAVYVRSGRCIPHKWASVLVYFMVAVLLAFGVWRNIKF